MVDATASPEFSFLDREHMEGYTDGGDISLAEPGDNRSEAYKHSFRVRRAEEQGLPIPAHISRSNVDRIRREHEKTAPGRSPGILSTQEKQHER